MKNAGAMTGVAAVLALLLTVSASSADIVYSWRGNGKNIALTFDDGPHPRYTPEILSILEEYDVRATFFVVGQNIEWYDGIVEKEQAAGHEIGNHTFSHSCLKSLSRDGIASEITRTESVINEKIEYRTKLIRPPGGITCEELKKLAESEDYTIVCWSIDTLDWAHKPSAEIAENILSSVKGGDIILFHDYISGGSPTPEALRIIIPELLERGYSFVTVSELIENK